MEGRRHDLTENDPAMAEGEYGKHWFDGNWYCWPPGSPYMGNLSGHDVTEHEDGTITVSPSIQVKYAGKEVWHGYLEHGVWRKV